MDYRVSKYYIIYSVSRKIDNAIKYYYVSTIFATVMFPETKMEKITRLGSCDYAADSKRD